MFTAEVRRTLAIPPVLWIIIIGRRYPRSRSSSPMPDSSSYIDWCRYAFSTVIIVRGYSYIRGATSEDRNTGIAPRKALWYSCWMISLMRRSFPGSRNDHSSETTNPRTPASTRYWICSSR